MFEYVLTAVLAALVGATVTSVFFLVRRLLDQQKEQSAALQTSINKQLDTIRQESIQGRGRSDDILADLQRLRRQIDDAIAARPAGDDKSTDGIKQILEKLDAISGQLAKGVTRGDAQAEKDQGSILEMNEVDWSRGRRGGGYHKGFLNQGGKFTSNFDPLIKGGDLVFPEAAPGLEVEIETGLEGIGSGTLGTKPFSAGRPTPTSGATSEGGPGSRPPSPAQAPPPDAGDLSDEGQIVDLMFATTRKLDDAQERFTGERSPTMTFGHAAVRIPEDRLPGELERPKIYTVFSFTIYREKEDPRRHFILRKTGVMSKEDWMRTLGSMPSDEALVFVHGFNNSFEDAVFRNAQIVWDLKFKGIAVLFSWASRGAIADYGYDRESAQLAQKPFIEVLEMLAGLANVRQIHVLAHSMGNQVVLNALANYKSAASSLKLGELVMAAPDVDRDVFIAIAPDARKLTRRMTLYASAADKALLASKFIAGAIPRAGDVPEGGPIVLENVDSIDATSLGEEIFGLNHGTFARSLSILNDVLLLLKGLALPRVVEISSVPKGVIPPKYWRYITSRS